MSPVQSPESSFYIHPAMPGYAWACRHVPTGPGIHRCTYDCYYDYTRHTYIYHDRKYTSPYISLSCLPSFLCCLVMFIHCIVTVGPYKDISLWHHNNGSSIRGNIAYLIILGTVHQGRLSSSAGHMIKINWTSTLAD